MGLALRGNVGNRCQNSNSREFTGAPVILGLRRSQVTQVTSGAAQPQAKGELVKNSLLVLSALMPFLATAKTANLSPVGTVSSASFNAEDPNLASDNLGGIEYALVLPDHSTPSQVSQLIREVQKLQSQGLLKFNSEDGVIEVSN